MTVFEMRNKLDQIIKEGRGDLMITLLTQDPNLPFHTSLIGIKEVTWGDRGGWGAEIAIIEPSPQVVIKKDKEV